MTQLIDRYCEVVLTGLNVQKGQCLNITAEPPHIPLLTTLAARAYRMGVKYVEMQIGSTALTRERILHSDQRYLSFVPKTITAKQDVLIRENWARLAVLSPEDPDVFHDTPQEHTLKVQTALRRAQEKYKQAVMTDKFNWNVCSIPTQKWAGKVLKTAPSPKAERRLWGILTPIYRLNHADPVAVWREHCAALSARAKQLTAFGIEFLRFRAPRTDLKVGLRREALWKGGGSVSAEGIRFIPNLPTEEVYTTPDFRATEGRVRLTRPAIVFEKEVIDGEIEFSGGKVTRVAARKNRQTLEDMISIDAGAGQLGEIALVDSSSPIFKSKRIFYNILLDENAACHFAFGGAYPSCLRGGLKMDTAERTKNGINQSLIHTDVMIGSEEMDITATTYDGKTLQIMKGGVFRDIS